MILENGELQIDYGNPFGLCTTKKEKETNREIEISGKCSSGLDNLFDTVVRPLDFDSTVLKGITFKHLYFNSELNIESVFSEDGTYEYTSTFNSMETGTFEDSIYKNVVKVTITNSSIFPEAHLPAYSLLFLAEGNISNGKLVEVRYFENSDNLKITVFKIIDGNLELTSDFYSDFYEG